MMERQSTSRQTLRQMFRSPMQKTFTFLGFTLIIIIILLLTAIRPTFNKISTLRSDIRAKESVNEQLQTKLNNLNTLQEIYLEREDDLSVIELYFPSDMDYSLVMASLEKITEKYGYELVHISIVKAEKSRSSRGDYAGMEKVTISMTVSGDRADFKNLLSHLEESPIIPNIMNIRIDPVGLTETGGEIDATITMYVYKTI